SLRRFGNVACRNLERPMSEAGQTRSFSDVGSMSGLPDSGHGWAIKRPSLTPLADLGRQAPLHRLRAGGSGASVKNINVARYLGEQLPRSLICPSEGLSTGGNGSRFPSSRPRRQSDLIVLGARISTGSLRADPSESTAHQPKELRWSL